MIKQSSNGSGSIRVVMFFHFFLLTRISNRKNSTLFHLQRDVGHINTLVRGDLLWFPEVVAGRARYSGSRLLGEVVASNLLFTFPVDKFVDNLCA